MTEEEWINRASLLSDSIKAVLDTEPDYGIRHSVMSAHVQRMICDEAQNQPRRARKLGEKFHELCMRKIVSITTMAYPS